MKIISKDGPMVLVEIKSIYKRDCGNNSYYELVFSNNPKEGICTSPLSCFLCCNEKSVNNPWVPKRVIKLKKGDKIWIDQTSTDIYRQIK